MKPASRGRDRYYDFRRRLSSRTRSTIYHGAVLSCLLVAGIILIFLYEWRTAIVCIIAIPLSLLAAGLILFMSGATVNTMTLAGFVIALGVVVDDAILGVENIMRRLRLAAGGRSAKHGAHRFWSVARGAGADRLRDLIVVAAVVRSVYRSLTGAFFKPLIAAYVLAIRPRSSWR